MRRLLKFLHTLAAVGMGGALATHLVLLASLPDPASLEAYAAARQGIALVSRYILLPSLGLVLVSGLLAMASGDRFYNAGWAWAKLGTGVLLFEGTLVTVQRPAERAATQSYEALQDNLAPEQAAQVAQLVASEWASLWVILALVVANIALGVWRPRFGRRKNSGVSESA
jgi:hypothetical protein